MTKKLKIGVVTGVIVGLAIVMTLQNYSNYKKDQAIESDESSSITSADHNETTNVATTAKTTTTTTTVTTTTAASQTTTTTSSKVPIKWIKTDLEQITGEYTIEGSEWTWEDEELPKLITHDTSTIYSPRPQKNITINGCDFRIKVSFNSDAEARDLIVYVFDDAFRSEGEKLDDCKIVYSEKSPEATITGSVGFMDQKIVIKSENTGKEYKTIPISLKSNGEFISSDPSIIEFSENGYALLKSGKVILSYMVNGKVVVKKEIEVKV